MSRVSRAPAHLAAISSPHLFLDQRAAQNQKSPFLIMDRQIGQDVLDCKPSQPYDKILTIKMETRELFPAGRTSYPIQRNTPHREWLGDTIPVNEEGVHALEHVGRKDNG